MKISEAFPSNFLKVEDLAGNRVTVTIDRVEIEPVGKDDQKPVVYFRGKKKGLVLNKTNAESITDIVGSDEMDDWEGHRVVLHPDKTQFQGKRVACIRVAEPAPVKAEPVAKKKPVPAVEVEADPDDDEASVGHEFADDEEAPF